MVSSEEKGITRPRGLGLPRRAAVQGIAGSLAGIAALGAVQASAKKNKKNKKSSAGTLVRVELATKTESVELSSARTITADCAEPGGKETVAVLGGGFDFSTSPDVTDFIIRQSQAGANGRSWTINVANTDATDPHDATAQAVCGYFRKK